MTRRELARSAREKTLLARAVSDYSGRADRDKLAGPFYDEAGAARILAAHSSALRRRDLIETVTASGIRLHPTFQFDRTRARPDAVRCVRIVKPVAADDQTTSWWFHIPRAKLHGSSAQDRAVAHEDRQLTITLAKASCPETESMGG